MKSHPECRTAVLRLRLGACVTAPTKRMVADLHDAARLSNAAANAMLQHWLHKARCLFGTVRAIQCKGLPKGRLNRTTGKRSEPTPARSFEVLDLGPARPTLPEELLPKRVGIELYRAGELAAPELSPSILAVHSSASIMGLLLKDAPWRIGGPKATRRMWQAMLWCDGVSAPCFRQVSFPVPSSGLTLKVEAGRGCTLTFPLWSTRAGRKQRGHTCRIEYGQLPAGVQEIVRRVAVGEGDWKLCDSEMVWHESRRRGKGWWAFHMVYRRAPAAKIGKPERVAVLTMQDGHARHPFQVATADAFPWELGDGPILMADWERLQTRRTVIEYRSRHRDAGPGKKGHGRRRAMRAVRPLWRATADLTRRSMQQAVARVIAYCVRHNCGTLAWTAPAKSRRAITWFGAKDIPFDYTAFEQQLDHQCWLHGIARGRVVDETPEAARGAQAGTQEDVGTTGGTREAATGRKKPRRSRDGGESPQKSERRDGQGATGGG